MTPTTYRTTAIEIADDSPTGVARLTRERAGKPTADHVTAMRSRRRQQPHPGKPQAAMSSWQLA